MISIGETLRRERLKRRLDLDGVSRQLKIPPRLLEAIEDERFDRLPGGVFAKSFVRQYARMLGLDEEEIVGELQRMLEPPPPEPEPELRPVKNTPVSLARMEVLENMGDTHTGRSSTLRSLVLVILVMLVCSAVYAWWQRGGHFPWRLVLAREDAPAPVETVRAPVAPVAPVAEATPQPQSAPETPAEAPKEDAATVDADATADTTRETPEVLPSTPPPASPSADAGVRVEITAQEQQRVWFSARADGKFLYAVTLEPNESRTVEASKTVLLKLGNAGGANFSLNGKPVGPVGPKGQIRSVQFTSGGFQIVLPDASNSPAPKDLLDDPF
jgi:cytoskeleton protein RodZ